MMSTLLFLIIFLAALQQSLSGFGFALVSMPLLVTMLGLPVAAPLVAGLALELNIINSIRWRKSMDFHEIRRLGIWLLLGVPLGVLSVDYLPEEALKRGLGALLVGYALFALLKPEKLPVISRRWAYPAGFLAGVLGGAYNTSGPPLILYGHLRQWPEYRFRAVLQGVFALSAALVVTGHGLAHHYTPAVLRVLAVGALAAGLGVAAGSWLDRRLQARHLRVWIILVTLVLGVALFRK